MPQSIVTPNLLEVRYERDSFVETKSGTKNYYKRVSVAKREGLNKNGGKEPNQ